jgi:alkyl hydroperoxide reductase subunit AhpC
MDQFVQLRDQVKEFEKRQTQVLFVFPQEAALNRHWLRGRDKWEAEITEFFGTSADKHPWLKSRGRGAEETKVPVLADPSFTTSADYGRALHAWGSFGNHPATFAIDREGIIRFIDYAKAAGKNGSDRPTAEQLLRTIDGLGTK